MAFLGRCYGCRGGNHIEHTKLFDTPPADSMLMGGGHCVCFECEPDLGHLDSANPNPSGPNPEPSYFEWTCGGCGARLPNTERHCPVCV